MTTTYYGVHDAHFRWQMRVAVSDRMKKDAGMGDDLGWYDDRKFNNIKS